MINTKKTTSFLLIIAIFCMQFTNVCSLFAEQRVVNNNLSPSTIIGSGYVNNAFSKYLNNKSDFLNFIDQDEASWISFLLLFAQRGHFSSLKYRAIANIGALEEIPDYFRSDIRVVLGKALREKEEEVSSTALNSICKLIYEKKVDKYEYLDLLIYVIENFNNFRKKDLSNAIFILLEYESMPDFHKQRLKAALLHLAVKNYSPVYEIACSVLRKMHENNLLDLSFNKKLLEQLIEVDDALLKRKEGNFNIVTDSEHIGFNLSDESVLELFDIFRSALGIDDKEKYTSDILSVIDSLLSQNYKAFNLGQKKINLGANPFVPIKPQVKRSTLNKVLDNNIESDTELLGRTIQITTEKGMVALKAQKQNEDDDSFLLEASIMQHDKRFKTRTLDAKVLEIPIADVKKIVKDERFYKDLKVFDQEYIRFIYYRPKENYFAYGENEIKDIPDSQRKKFIEDFIKTGIDDIFYFLNNYSRAYIDILPIMHEPIKPSEHKAGRAFSLEALPVGDIEEFKQACNNSNLRVSGLADFALEHSQLLYKEVDIFSIWFFSRYQLFQLMLKTANLSYKGRLTKNQMKEVLKSTYDYYMAQLRELIDLEQTNKIQETEIDKFIEETVEQLCFALEVCHDDKIFPIKEEFEQVHEGNRSYIFIRNWRWGRDDLGPYSSDFPVPALLNLVKDSISDLVIESIDKAKYSNNDEKNEDKDNFDPDDAIALIDSGTGGAILLNWLLRESELDNEKFILFADTAAFPFGNKTKRQLQNIIMKDVRLLDFHTKGKIKALIVASGTASMATADLLRETCKMPVFDIIEASSYTAIRLSEETNKDIIGVLATEATVKSNAYENSIKSMGANKLKVISNPVPEMIELMQNYHPDNDKRIENLIQKEIDNLIAQGASSVILGCTHLALFRDKFIKAANGEMTVIDPTECVLAELKQYLENENLINKETPEYRASIIKRTNKGIEGITASQTKYPSIYDFTKALEEFVIFRNNRNTFLPLINKIDFLKRIESSI